MTVQANRDVSEIADVFLRDGYVHLPQVLSPAELEVLRADTGEIVEGGYAGKEPQSDYFHDLLPGTDKDVFHRVQYVFPKARHNSLLILLGHPFILEIVRHLLGEDFVCAAEALVFKVPENGREVNVHADCDPSDPRLSPLIFNIDYYLDDSALENGCLYVAPGSHKACLSGREIAEQGFNFPGLKPITARAGDILLHNVRVVHGSHRSAAPAMRRTLYYEFQSMDALLKQGGPRPGHPVNDNWIRDRFRLTMAAIEARRTCSYGQNEPPYPYQPPIRYNVSRPQAGEEINLRPALGYSKYI